MATTTDLSDRALQPQPIVKEPVARNGTARARVMLLFQVVVTIAAFGYLFHISDIPALTRSFQAAPLWSVPLMTLTLLAVMFTGTIRWRFLLTAYGAKAPPPLVQLFRLQLIGLFYNMMPGAVGGDVLRGWVSRHAFGPRGIGAGLTVVLVERVFGLIALILLVTSVLTFHPIRGLELPTWLFGMGVLASILSLGAIAVSRRLAPHLPRVIGEKAAALPELSHPVAFLLAMGASVVNQALVGLMGHCAVGSLAPNVNVLDSLVLAPLAFAAIFFPLTVAGAGTRDAAMVWFYGLLGVARETALSASIEILLAYVLVAALGGALSLVTPLRDAADPT